MVVIYHANIIVSLDKYYDTDPYKLLMAGEAGVLYFFVLSGFVMVLAHWNDLHGNPDWLGFIWKRFRRLYPLLWAVLLPLMLLIAASPTYSPSGNVNAIDFLLALLIFPIPNDAYVEPFLIVEWTLRYEIVFYALFLVLIFSRKVFWALIAAFILALFADAAGLSSESFGFWLAPYFMLFFMGMAAGYICKTTHIRYSWAIFRAGLVFLALCLWFGRGGFSTWLILGVGLSSAFVQLGAVLIEKNQPSKVERFFAFLGDASYSIYLVHYPLLSIFTKIMVKLTPSHNLAFAVISLLAVAGGIACHLLVERPLLRRIPRTVGTTGHLPKET